MKSIVELNTQLAEVLERGGAILTKGEAENRRLDDGEMAEYNSICEQAASIRAEIKKAQEIQTKITVKQEKMESKQFSLLRAVRSIVDGTPFDDVNAAVIAAGIEQHRAAGQSPVGRIVIPTGEARATVSVTGTSGATVPVEVANIFDELRAESVLEKAGATFYNGLVGNLKVPIMSAASVAWAAENGAASDAGASISSVTLTPKRLTAYLDISKQMLVQDAGSDVEAKLMANLARAINDKFEATVLGSSAGATTYPAGMFYNVSATSATTWADVTALMASVERAKGKVKAVIASPESKAAFRAMTYNNANRLVYENGNLEGVPCFSTANVASQNFVLGDFSYLVCGTWGGIDLTVDPYGQAGNGAIRLVVNVFMDANVANANVFAYGDTTPVVESTEETPAANGES